MPHLINKAYLNVPASGYRALSLSEAVRFQAMETAFPEDKRFRWRAPIPVEERLRNPYHPPDDPALHLYFIDGVPVAGVETVRDSALTVVRFRR